MKQRSKASRPRAAAGGKSVVAKATPWIFVGALALIAVLFAKYYPASKSTSAGTGPSTNAPGASGEEQDRALRKEQLDAVQKLQGSVPDNDDATYLAGLVRNDQGDSETAINLWKRALELDPSRADASESIGYALLLRDRYEEAESYLRQAVQIDPKLASARLRLATALSEQGKMQEIIPVLEGPAGRSAEAQRLLGDARQSLHAYAEARTNYEAAIALKTGFVEAHYGLSKVFARLGDTNQSQLHFEAFTRWKALGEERARAVRAKFDPLAVTRKSVAQTHTDVARVWLTLGRAGEAEVLWIRAAALDPENSLCRLQLAVLCQQTKRDQEALRYYREVAKLDPSDGLVQLNLGRVSVKLNLFAEAEKAFRQVIELAPEQPDGYSALARLFLQTNQKLDELDPLMENVMRLAPDAAAFELLSQAKAKKGDYASAITAIDKALELAPGNPHYQQLRGLLLQRK